MFLFRGETAWTQHQGALVDAKGGRTSVRLGLAGKGPGGGAEGRAVAAVTPHHSRVEEKMQQRGSGGGR